MTCERLHLLGDVSSTVIAYPSLMSGAQVVGRKHWMAVHRTGATAAHAAQPPIPVARLYLARRVWRHWSFLSIMRRPRLRSWVVMVSGFWPRSSW